MDKDRKLAALRAQNTDLERMNARLQSDLDWMKHRLTQVERERGQLMQAVLGVKVSVPEFVPTYRPDEALNEESNPFGDSGEDSSDPKHRFGTEHGRPADGVNYALMPGYTAPKE